MYISEAQLTRKILTGQIEILSEVLTTLRQKREEKILMGHERAANALMTVTIEYSEYRTTLTRERYSIKPGD